MHKPVAVMGATQGMWGTVRMQTAFLPVFTFLNMNPVLQPEILVAYAQNNSIPKETLATNGPSVLLKRK